MTFYSAVTGNLSNGLRTIILLFKILLILNINTLPNKKTNEIYIKIKVPVLLYKYSKL